MTNPSASSHLPSTLNNTVSSPLILHRTWILESPKLRHDRMALVRFKYHMYTDGYLAIDVSSKHHPDDPTGWKSEYDPEGFMANPIWSQSKGE